MSVVIDDIVVLADSRSDNQAELSREHAVRSPVLYRVKVYFSE